MSAAVVQIDNEKSGELVNETTSPLANLGISESEFARCCELADGVSDQDFESAIEEAKAEGDLSHANVVRKLKIEINPNETSIFVELITTTWKKTVESIFETGRLMLDAKARLAHGQFEKMIESELPFGPRTARHLMAIADNTVLMLANRNHGSVLPASWRTLSELARVPSRILESAIVNGDVTPDMTRSEAIALRPKIRHRAPKKTVSEMKSRPKFDVSATKRKLTALAKMANKGLRTHDSRFRADVLADLVQELRQLRERL